LLDHEPTYPPLDRAEFLAERACVPNYVPRYCAEETQYPGSAPYLSWMCAMIRSRCPIPNTPFCFFYYHNKPAACLQAV